jgi:5-(carboxyamino)imidazole ribonucleotide mutase
MQSGKWTEKEFYMAKVIIIMGSKSDLDIMKKAEDFLNEQGIENKTYVASAHRNPDKVKDIAKEIEETADIVIAGAGMAAHLPGVVASLVTKPVIGVPIDSGSLQGYDALLAIVQMPTGIPVATVAVNGSKNAAILAMQILALSHDDIKEKFTTFRKKQSEA